MLLGLLVFVLLVVALVFGWFIGIIGVLYELRTKHPRAYAEIVAKRKRGGKDAISS